MKLILPIIFLITGIKAAAEENCSINTNVSEKSFEQNTYDWLTGLGYSIDSSSTNQINIKYLLEEKNNSNNCSNIEFERLCTITLDSEYNGTYYTATSSECIKNGFSSFFDDFIPCNKALEQLKLNGCSTITPFTEPILKKDYIITQSPNFRNDDRISQKELDRFPIQRVWMTKKPKEGDGGLSGSSLKYEVIGKDGKLEIKEIDLKNTNTSPMTNWIQDNIIYDKDLNSGLSDYWQFWLKGPYWWRFYQFFPLNEEHTAFSVSMYMGKEGEITDKSEFKLRLPGENAGISTFIIHIDKDGKPKILPRSREFEKVSIPTGSGSTISTSLNWDLSEKAWVNVKKTEDSSPVMTSLQFIKFDLDNNLYKVDKEIEVPHPANYFNLPIADKYELTPGALIELPFRPDNSEWIGYSWRREFVEKFGEFSKYYFFNTKTGVQFFLKELLGLKADTYAKEVEERFFKLDEDFVANIDHKTLTWFNLSDLAKFGKNTPSWRKIDFATIVDRKRYNFRFVESLDKNTFIAIKTEKYPPGSFAGNMTPRDTHLLIIQIGEDNSVKMKEIFKINKLSPGWFFNYDRGISYKNGKFKFSALAWSGMNYGDNQPKNKTFIHEIDLKK